MLEKKHDLFNSTFYTPVEENADDEENIERSNLKRRKRGKVNFIF